MFEEKSMSPPATFDMAGEFEEWRLWVEKIVRFSYKHRDGCKVDVL